MIARLIVAAVGALTLTASAAAPLERELRLTPEEIAALTRSGPGAGTSGLAGITTTLLSGDPSKPGPYTFIINVPPHTKIAAHEHRDERSAMVVAGKWHFGYGKTASTAATKALPPGSFYTEPANVSHFAETGDEGATVYIWGFGPTDTRYTDPKDAPHP